MIQSGDERLIVLVRGVFGKHPHSSTVDNEPDTISIRSDHDAVGFLEVHTVAFVNQGSQRDEV